MALVAGGMATFVQASAAQAADPLISQGKPVLASSEGGTGYVAKNAVDGSTTTRWASVTNSDPQWIRIDLGATKHVSNVTLVWDLSCATAYKIQVSGDGTTFTDAYSTTTGKGATESIPLNATGRYVRMLGTVRCRQLTTAGYSLQEFKVYGANPTPVLLSQGHAAKASSEGGAGYVASNAFDGNTATRWASTAKIDPQWLRVDLGASASITSISLVWDLSCATAYQLQVSNDDVTYTSIKTVTAGVGGTETYTLSATGRYVRMYGTARCRATGGYSLQEFKVFGIGGAPGPSPSPTPTPTPTPPPTTKVVTAKINFQDAATTIPAGYLKDVGQAYGPRTDAGEGTGLTYGWVNSGTTTPVSLEGFARARKINPDVRLDTFMHMQFPQSTSVPNPPRGDWQIATANGFYTVTVAVGDDGPATNSINWIDIGNENAIAAFANTGAAKHMTVTRTVQVTNGVLNLTQVYGSNTKINYVDIAPVTDAATRPYVLQPHPLNHDTGVDPAASIVADLHLPSGGVAEASLNTSSVMLTRVSDGVKIAGNVSTSGGGDTINFSPAAPLTANTLYRFDVTSNVTDVAGHKFLPFSSIFTTGSVTAPPTGIAFDKLGAVATGQMYTSLTKGPDGKLYAGTLTGQIFRWTINADGSLSNQESIETVRNHATANNLPGAPNRTVLGLTFDPSSTAANPILWITDNSMYAGGTPNEPNWSGFLAKLTGANLENYQEVLTHLPRSVKDHEVNSIAFGPDGALYFPIGAMSAMGDADPTWGNRVENKLSGAVVRLDLTKLPATLPLNVQTDEGGTYDPNAAGAPLTVYATGIRNAFDLVWHSNGHLYAPTNGSAAGGNIPATPATLPAACQNRIDKATAGAWTGPATPGVTSNPAPQTDFVYDVKKNRYYGHPDPARCEYSMDNGNPTTAVDPFEVAAYPAGVKADRNFDLADTYDAGLHSSADGTIEYKSSVFGGKLKGKLLNVRYSDGQDIQTFDVASTGTLSNRATGIPGFTGFLAPLDVTEDTANGDLYVSELGNADIVLLKPHEGTTTPSPVTVQNLDPLPFADRMVFSHINAAGMADANEISHDTGVLRISNGGSTTATVNAVPVTGPFTIVNPPKFPANIAVGGTLDLTVKFVATSGRISSGSLTVQSAANSVPVQLAGYWQSQSEQGNEPTLTEIGQLMGYKTNLPATFPSQGHVSAVGDEVLSPYWKQVDTKKPVLVQQIAGYHTYPHTAAISRFDKATKKQTVVFEMNGNGAQTMFPPIATSTTALAQAIFNSPTAPFGFNIGSEMSDDTLNDVTVDHQKGCVDPCGHHMRFFPVKDRNGFVVPNQWIMSMDYSGINYDFQDNVYLITNVAPNG